MTPPQTYNDLKALIAARAPGLPPRLQTCAAYALREPDKIAFSTVVETAQAAGVQPSAFVRFAQTLGYAGFSGMQQVFRMRLAERAAPDYRERLEALEDQGGPGRLLGGFIESASASIARLERDVDAAAFSEAARRLAEADTVYVVGMRRSYPAAAYLSYSLARLNLRVILLDQTGGMLEDRLRAMTRRDVLAAVSFQPYSSETLMCAERARAAGAAVVAISDGALSPLTRVASAALEVNETDFGAFRSLSATMCLSLALAVAAGEARRGKAKLS